MLKRLLTHKLFLGFSSPVIDSEFINAKPFSAIPTVSIAKVLMRSLPGGIYYKKNTREINQLLFKEFGSVLKMPGFFGKPEIVITFNADDFKTTFRNEGVWPERFGLETLKHYRTTRRPEIYAKYGNLLTSHDEQWHKIRSLANPILMQPEIIKLYTTQIDTIAKEFINVMKKLRNNDYEMPANFASFIKMWALESIASIAVEKRLNILNGTTKDEKAMEIIKCVRKFLELAPEFDSKTSIWRYYETKAFKELMNVYDELTSLVLYNIDEAMENIKTEKKLEVSNESILRKLLRIDKDIAVIIACDLFVGGIDTTASVVIYVLYMLAKNPDKQEKLRQEILSALPEKESVMTADNLKNLPYLRAVIKESLRLNPVADGNTRKIANDVVLSGYHVPKNTLIVMISHNELSNPKYYSEPEKFLPERWLRNQEKNPQCPQASDSNPFTYLPFGFGARSCIGKRIVELEIEILLSNIIRNFKLEWHHPDMKIKHSLLNLPISELKFKVTDV